MGRAARAGLMGGAVTIFLALVGLVERFTDLQLVGEQVTFSRMLVLLPPLIVGYIVGRPWVERGEPRSATVADALTWGAVAGAAAGALVGFAAVAVEAFGVERVRAVFIQATEGLIDFLTFDLGVVTGALLLTAVSAIAGMAGGALHVVPDGIRKPIVTAVVAVLLMGFLQRIVPVALAELGLERDWLYVRASGLTWFGAIVVAAVAAVASIVRARKGDAIRTWLASGRRSTQVGDGADEVGGGAGLDVPRLILLVVAGAVLLVAPQVLGATISEVLGRVMVFVLLGLGLNIVVGYAGLLDLGYVAFYAFGAYALGVLTGGNLNSFQGIIPPVVSADLSFYVAIPIVVALAALVGLLIGAPVLRLRGDYLALVTLGLGEIVTVLVASP